MTFVFFKKNKIILVNENFPKNWSLRYYVGVEVYEDCIISCVPIVTVQSIAMPYEVSVCV